MPGALLLALLPSAITIANIWFAVSDTEEVMGVSLLKVHALNGILLLGIIVHFVYAKRHVFFPCRRVRVSITSETQVGRSCFSCY